MRAVCDRLDCRGPDSVLPDRRVRRLPSDVEGRYREARRRTGGHRPESWRQDDVPETAATRIELFGEKDFQRFRALWLEQPEIAQFPAQRFGHRCHTAGGRFAEVARCRVVGEVSPALERPHGTR
jgi:hypothetical protein